MKKFYDNDDSVHIIQTGNTGPYFDPQGHKIPPPIPFDLTSMVGDPIARGIPDTTQQDILKELKEIKALLQVNREQINRLAMDEYFKKTAWKYVNGTLHLNDSLMEDFSAVPMSVQIEHERWQVRTFGGIKYEE